VNLTDTFHKQLPWVTNIDIFPNVCLCAVCFHRQKMGRVRRASNQVSVGDWISRVDCVDIVYTWLFMLHIVLHFVIIVYYSIYHLRLLTINIISLYDCINHGHSPKGVLEYWDQILWQVIHFINQAQQCDICSLVIFSLFTEPLFVIRFWYQWLKN